MSSLVTLGRKQLYAFTFGFKGLARYASAVVIAHSAEEALAELLATGTPLGDTPVLSTSPPSKVYSPMVVHYDNGDY